ncbi:hypothetical protein DRQ26_07200 [bacterium]|nr:MAG: hypothetical protein DRQ26_07200 [bacterium]
MLQTKIKKKANGLIKKIKEYVPTTKSGLKAVKLEEIEKSTVTLTNGKLFDSDEESQNRILRAIQVLTYKNEISTMWKLADNTTSEVTLDEFNEALVLAGEQQSAIWFE